MWKKAFLKLPEDRKQALMDVGMDVYIENPYEDITIRLITDTLQINMATFYRYFDEKEDFALYIYRDIYRRFMDSEVNIFRTTIPMDRLSEKERKFIGQTEQWPDEMHRRMIFEIGCEFALPLVKRSLQIERLKGNLRANVPEDFAAYMYVTAEYNFRCYCKYHNIQDPETLDALFSYMDDHLFLEGVMEAEAREKGEG